MSEALSWQASDIDKAIASNRDQFDRVLELAQNPESPVRAWFADGSYSELTSSQLDGDAMIANFGNEEKGEQ